MLRHGCSTMLSEQFWASSRITLKGRRSWIKINRQKKEDRQINKVRSAMMVAFKALLAKQQFNVVTSSTMVVAVAKKIKQSCVRVRKIEKQVQVRFIHSDTKTLRQLYTERHKRGGIWMKNLRQSVFDGLNYYVNSTIGEQNDDIRENWWGLRNTAEKKTQHLTWKWKIEEQKTLSLDKATNPRNNLVNYSSLWLKVIFPYVPRWPAMMMMICISSLFGKQSSWK